MTNEERRKNRVAPTRGEAGKTLTLAAKEYIEAHSAEKFSLQAVADALFVNGSYLLRVFKANTGHTLLAAWYHIRLMRLQNRYGLHVPVNCFGKGLTIFHLYPILMNGNVTVGEYCRIMPGVKIVGDDTPEDRAPVLGDHVTLGAGCIVVGGIELADGITVGAGAVVTKSFPEPGITIAGVPAKKLG